MAHLQLKKHNYNGTWSEVTAEKMKDICMFLAYDFMNWVRKVG